MELVQHAKSVSDKKKSLFVLLACYVVLALFIILYTLIISAGSDFEYQNYNKITFTPMDLRQIEQQTERFYTPPERPATLKKKKISEIPKIVEKDSIVEKDTLTEKKTTIGFVDTTQIQKGDGNITKTDETEHNDELNEKEILLNVDKLPVPPGGELGLRRYIATHLKYPKLAIEKKIEGLVLIKFCITSAGNVTKTSIVQSADPILDQEALRVINTLPNWTPGEQRGKKVNVWYTLPIVFDLGN